MRSSGNRFRPLVDGLNELKSRHAERGHQMTQKAESDKNSLNAKLKESAKMSVSDSNFKEALSVIPKYEWPHYAFGRNTLLDTISRLEPVVKSLSKAGVRKPKEVSKALIKSGFRTACDGQWTELRVKWLLSLIFSSRGISAKHFNHLGSDAVKKSELRNSKPPFNQPKAKNRKLSPSIFSLQNPELKSVTRTTSSKRAKLVSTRNSPKPTTILKPKQETDYTAFVERMMPRISLMALDELRAIWANCIRVMTERKTDPAVFRLMEAIENRWNSHIPLDAYDQHFRWPDTWAVAGKNKGFEFDQPDGMFSYLEYRVGRTNGQSMLVRQTILKRMFEGKLPRVFAENYMAQWGDLKTARRLQKMAETLASFTKNLKRRENEKFDDAIRDWEADLRFLYETYYIKFFNFGWPTTSL